MNTRQVPQRFRQAGISIVELMISATLGLFIVGAVLALFVSSKQAYNDTDRLGQLTEGGRYALNVLSDELRHADFWAGLRPADLQLRADLDSIADDCSGDAAGYAVTRAVWAESAAAASVAGCITDAKLDSDVLLVKHVLPEPVAAGALGAGRTYLMANPVRGVLFDGADAAPTTAVGGDVPNGQAWEYAGMLFYVTETGGAPTLMRRRLLGNVWQAAEEVARGVELLHIEFGEDADGDGTADRYGPASAVQWPQVVAANIYLLARTDQPDGTYRDTRTYHFGSLTVTPPNGDGYHRMAFQSTVNLRNRYLQFAGDQAVGG